jgi:hypothetical protein
MVVSVIDVFISKEFVTLNSTNIPVKCGESFMGFNEF